MAQNARELYADLAELKLKVLDLDELLKNDRSNASLDQVGHLPLEICYLGESILLRQKQLALSKYAYGFLHSKDTFRGPRDNVIRLRHELRQLVKDTQVLLRGFDELEREGEDFLVRGLSLPDHLEGDFYQARDLFSCGFDDVGLLIAARGLEGVLRQILADRRISIESSRDDTPLYDVVETFRQLRWRDGTPFLSRDAIQVLHLLRTIRNIGAHPRGSSMGSPRELAPIIARFARQIWQLHWTRRRQRLGRATREVHKR